MPLKYSPCLLFVSMFTGYVIAVVMTTLRFLISEMRVSLS